MKLGIIARSDNTGLGNQSRELVNMLKPNKILLIDSAPFNKNKQHPEWYSEYSCVHSIGFPTKEQIKEFLNQLDVVISCETFYDENFIDYSKKAGVKTILQYNYELFGNFSRPDLLIPDMLLAPSSWNIDIINKMFGDKTKIVHLPPPTSPQLFSNSKIINLSKDHNKILHIAGKKAAKDRNGTETVLEMLKFSKADYELVIRSQTEIKTNIKDSRLKIEIGDIKNREDMYSGFDAMVLPRRYAGLCLPMNEALMSALPVFMTDISPNNKILPKEWLVPSSQIGQFKAKVRIKYFEANQKELAKTIDNYINYRNKNDKKQNAFELGVNNFSPDVLINKYLNIISHI